MKRLAAILLAIALAPAEAAPIVWREWSDDVFEEAKREHKFVLLDLEAVWCHWCHVMDEKTYADPEVARLIDSRYIAVRVDQDSRPDLSNRYEDYGWPATVVFTADGSEIVKRQGYIPPLRMASMLQAIIDDPSPGPSVQAEAEIAYTTASAFSDSLRKDLENTLAAGYDEKLSSWGTIQKFLDAPNVEYALASKNPALRKMAMDTLDAQLQLIDPAWGGVYQYSAEGDWKHPHFEKIMSVQANNLRVYALAYGMDKNPKWLAAVEDIRRYLRDFLTSPDGAFYTSQDADLVAGEHSIEYFALNDADRRRRGIPRIDQHIYARENGWAIAALVTLAEITGEKAPLDEATRAAKWILQNRALPGGGFSHGAADPAGPYLGDTLAMGQAFLVLHEATADPAWLAHASAAATFLGRNFAQDRPAGLADTEKSAPQFDENVQVARFANLLSRYTNNEEQRALAIQALRYVATPAVVRKRRAFIGGVLLAERELAATPIHVTVIAPENDPAAAPLLAAARAHPRIYKQIERITPGTNSKSTANLIFPPVKSATAFLCTEIACSAGIKNPQNLRSALERSLTAP